MNPAVNGGAKVNPDLNDGEMRRDTPQRQPLQSLTPTFPLFSIAKIPNISYN